MRGVVRSAMAVTAVAAAALTACSSDTSSTGTSVSTTSATSTTSRPEPSYEPRYREADCPAAVGAAPGFSCHVLTVPEDPTDPTGNQVELPVLRALDHVGDEPVVVLHGGPGGAAVDDWAAWRAMVEPTVDLVLYDQRGGGSAIPRLDCPEYDDALFGVLASNSSAPAERAAIEDAVEACHHRLTGLGTDLGQYDTPANTRDLEDLRRALGASRMTLVASSYGSRVALDYLRTHPERVRALVLDAVDPPDGVGRRSPADLAGRAVEQLLSACTQDPACARTSPNLEADLTNVLAAFDEAPRPVELAMPDGSTRTILVSGDELYAGLFAAMYDTTVIPLLPSIVGMFRSDSGTELLDSFSARILPALRSTATGAYLSVECADSGGADGPGADGPGAPPSRATTILLAGPSGMCASWPVAAVDDSFRDTVAPTNPPPTLVVTGELDPITPADDARRVAGDLDAVLLEIPRGGHSPLRDDRCATSVLASFLADPADPDLSCVDAMTPRPFS